MDDLLTKDTKLEELREAYYSAIALLNPDHKQDILDLLPSADTYNCLELFHGILDKIQSDINFFKIEAEVDGSQSEIERLNSLFQIVKNRLEEIKVDINSQPTLDDIEDSLNLIFASGLSDTYFNRDLKDMPNESYDKIIEMLETLRTNSFNRGNPEEFKRLSNSDKIKGVYELKEFKIRIFFQFISKDSIYIFLISEKKANKDKLLISEIASRKKQTKKQFGQTCEMFRDDEQRCAIISQNKLVYQGILDYLNANKKGVRKDV